MSNQNPNEIKFERMPRDPETGVAWVYVSRNMAHAHPLGQLGVVLWLIVGWLILTGLFKLYWLTQINAPLTVTLLAGALPFLAGVGLAMRVPWSVAMVMGMVGFTLFSMINGVAGLGHWALAEMVLSMLVLFYLIEADRPNLIYRYRYRSFKRGSDDP